MTDEFFGKLHINEAHMNAVSKIYDDTGTGFSVSEGTVEELSELITAICKCRRYGAPVIAGLTPFDHRIDNLVEEIAHVIICIRCLCRDYNISPEEIQARIIEKDKILYACEDDN